MAGFFNKLKPSAAASNGTNHASLGKRKEKEEPAPEMTPLEKMLQNAGPIREDGSDKFFGLENFGNTCYCNSIVQALYYSEAFRENVVRYPPRSPNATPNGKPPRVNVQIRPPMNGNAPNPANKKALTTSQAFKQRQAINSGQPLPGQQGQRPEDKPDSPEYKKKQAMIKGPVLELAQENAASYGMQECTFTGLKDIFMALIESNTRTGVLSPQRFLEIFRRDNEMFRNSMHQDAHEFYGLVLNDIINNLKADEARLQELQDLEEGAVNGNGLAQSVETALGASTALMKAQAAAGAQVPGAGWVHDIFEGVLTSETRCLTCETASQRDETFLDLSIDLEEHSSVTSCLRKFSAEEMLCERNKFHCDHCGGLQEAEKRMKIKKLPKVLALHLKRFKYAEDFTKLEKLFHRVVYPYHLRMFNTTDDADDPDRLYELYAVVVHIGGNAYHGHYVSVIKTQERGWLLFDDEMVEPVDKHYVRNFFGDKPGTACAYVLFYQETTFEKVVAEQEAEGLEEVKLASQKADLALGDIHTNGNGSALSKHITQPVSPIDDHEDYANLDHAQTAPDFVPTPLSPGGSGPGSINSSGSETHPLVAAPPPGAGVVEKLAPIPEVTPIKEDKARDKKEAKAAEKARKAAEKEQAKLEEKQQKEQAKLEEKQRREREVRLREARKNEAEELRKVMAASRQTAAEEEQARKRTTTTNESTDSLATGGTTKSPGFLGRSNRGSRSMSAAMSRKSFSFLGKDRDKDKDKSESGGSSENGHGHGGVNGTNGTNGTNGSAVHAHSQIRSPSQSQSQNSSDKPDKPPLKERFSFGIGRKKSNTFLP